MFFKPAAVVASLVFRVLAAAQSNQIIPWEPCPAGNSITRIYVQTQIINVPVIIDTFIEKNTIINIEGGITVSYISS
jgi:hypothetical protein